MYHLFLHYPLTVRMERAKSFFRSPLRDIRNKERARFQEPSAKRVFNQFDLDVLEQLACAPYIKLDVPTIRGVCITIQLTHHHLTILSTVETNSKSVVVIGMDVKMLNTIPREYDDDTTTSLLGHIKNMSINEYGVHDDFQNEVNSVKATILNYITDHAECVRELFPNATLGVIVQSCDTYFITKVEEQLRKFHNRIFFNKHNFDIRLPFTNTLTIVAMNRMNELLCDNKIRFTSPELFTSLRFANVEDAMMFLVREMRNYKCIEKCILINGIYEILKDYQSVNNKELTTFSTLLIATHWMHSIFPTSLPTLPHLA